MKKRLLALLLAVTVTSSLVACGAKETEAPVDDADVVADEVVDETPAPEPTTDETEVVVDDEEDEEEEEETVEELMGFNMIENPDFSGENLWFTYMNGGFCSMDIVDEQMVVDISDTGNLDYSVQIYYDGFKLVQGCQYEIKFDASSTIERDIEYRIQINGGDYHAYSIDILTLTPEMQTYDIVFTMEEASDPAPRLCFNMGIVNDVSVDPHQVAFDNFELYCIDDSGRIDGNGGPDRPKIQVNQIGYQPDDNKVAVFVGKNADSEFTIVDVATGDVVYEGTVDAGAKNPNTDRKEARADFSDFTTPGTYKIVGDNCGESFEFTIADDVYADAFEAALKMFYMQRCGVELPESYAGAFTHPACHTEMATIYGTSNKIDVSGGWHDAGDYGRYVVSGAKAVADLLLAYEDYPEAFNDNLGIPESGNGIADVLDEARFEIEWLMKMQADNGGVYHKVTCRNFPETVMPQYETEELVVTPISNTATGDFAAVMAMAARVYADVDADFAADCLAAAESAYEYLQKNGPDGGFTNPSDVVTGEYPDTVEIDERAWAAAELFKTTGESKYSDDYASIITEDFFGFGWADVGLYCAYAYATADGADATALNISKNILNNNAATFMENADKDTYYASILGDYVWGSNETMANQGMLFYMTGNDDYGKAQLDYLFGNNGTSYCFLTGFGSLSPEGTHHRPSQSLGMTMEGMLVGGPNCNLDDPYAQAVLQDTAPALCYVDNEQSYSCNEITVYWNSPLIYLMAAVMDK